MLVNSLPRLATVVGDLAGELQVAVAPLLRYIAPVLVRLPLLLATATHGTTAKRTI